MAVKFFSTTTEQSPLMNHNKYSYRYARNADGDGDGDGDDYSASSASTITRESILSFQQATAAPFRFRTSKWVILSVVFWASLCTTLACLTGYTMLHGGQQRGQHEHRHGHVHGHGHGHGHNKHGQHGKRHHRHVNNTNENISHHDENGNGNAGTGESKSENENENVGANNKENATSNMNIDTYNDNVHHNIHDNVSIHVKKTKKRKGKLHEKQKIADRAFRKHLLDSDPYSTTTTSSSSLLSDPCHAAIAIIRHCDKKGSIKGHCSDVGYQRAEYIATLFGNDENNGDGGGESYGEGENHKNNNSHRYKWPAPSYLFATAPGQRRNPHMKNYREIETLQPLGSQIGVDVNSSYGMKTKEKLTDHLFQLLKSGDLCGKVALISWKHHDVPRLALSLGCGPEEGCPTSWKSNDFDSTWQILYSYQRRQYPDVTMASILETEGNEKQMKVKEDIDVPASSLSSSSSSSSSQRPQWWISAHVQMEDFDPVAFRKGKVHKHEHKSHHHKHHNHHKGKKK